MQGLIVAQMRCLGLREGVGLPRRLSEGVPTISIQTVPKPASTERCVRETRGEGRGEKGEEGGRIFREKRDAPRRRRPRARGPRPRSAQRKPCPGTCDVTMPVWLDGLTRQ